MQSVDEVIAENKGLIYKQLRTFYLLNDPNAESAAYWALYKAITTYDTTKHTLLSTYATCCIYNALGDYVRTLKRAKNPLSYNAIAYEDVEFENMLSDNISTEDICVRSELVLKTKEAIQDICSKMTNPKQKAIVMTYVDNEYDIATKTIANELGVTQAYVSQILSEFKYKLKKKMEGYYRA